MDSIDSSTEARVGRILLLTGTVLQAIAALLFLMFTVLLGYLTAFVPAGASIGFGALYLVLGLLSIAGAIIAWTAFRSAGAGRLDQAGIRGLVAAFVPPLAVVTLIGALLCLLSPEAKRRRKAVLPAQERPESPSSQ